MAFFIESSSRIVSSRSFTRWCSAAILLSKVEPPSSSSTVDWILETLVKAACLGILGHRVSGVAWSMSRASLLCGPIPFIRLLSTSKPLNVGVVHLMRSFAFLLC